MIGSLSKILTIKSSHRKPDIVLSYSITVNRQEKYDYRTEKWDQENKKLEQKVFLATLSQEESRRVFPNIVFDFVGQEPGLF